MATQGLIRHWRCKIVKGKTSKDQEWWNDRCSPPVWFLCLSWRLWSQMMKRLKLKAHDERLLGPSKAKKRTIVPTWLLIYWFPSYIFSSRVLRTSKAISDFVGCCYIPLATGHSCTHTNTLEYNPMHKHRELPVGRSLILKYTAINQTPLPHAPARLSQWKAQASGTLIAIYRASHARRGASIQHPLFCNSLLLLPTTQALNWQRVEDVSYCITGRLCSHYLK